MAARTRESRHSRPSRPRMARNLFLFRCMCHSSSTRRRRRRGMRQKHLSHPKPSFAIAYVRSPLYPSKCPRCPQPSSSCLSSKSQMLLRIKYSHLCFVFLCFFLLSLSFFTSSLSHSLTRYPFSLLLLLYLRSFSLGLCPTRVDHLVSCNYVSFCCWLTLPVLQRYSPLFSASASC